WVRASTLLNAATLRAAAVIRLYAAVLETLADADRMFVPEVQLQQALMLGAQLAPAVRNLFHGVTLEVESALLHPRLASARGPPGGLLSRVPPAGVRRLGGDGAGWLLSRADLRPLPPLAPDVPAAAVIALRAQRALQQRTAARRATRSLPVCGGCGC